MYKYICILTYFNQSNNCSGIRIMNVIAKDIYFHAVCVILSWQSLFYILFGLKYKLEQYFYQAVRIGYSKLWNCYKDKFIDFLLSPNDMNGSCIKRSICLSNLSKLTSLILNTDICQWTPVHQKANCDGRGEDKTLKQKK